MMGKDINQDLSYSGGRKPDTLCGKLERPCKDNQEDKEVNVNRSNIYIYWVASATRHVRIEIT